MVNQRFDLKKKWVFPEVSDVILKTWREDNQPDIWPLELYNIEAGKWIKIHSADDLIYQTVGARTEVLE